MTSSSDPAIGQDPPEDSYLHWSPDPEGQTKRLTELTAYGGIGLTAIALVLVFAIPTPSLKLVGALMLAGIPAGAAVMCWVDAGEIAAQLGLTIVTSVTLVALGSAAMIWVNYWRPHVLLAVVVAMVVVSCTARLVARRGS